MVRMTSVNTAIDYNAFEKEIVNREDANGLPVNSSGSQGSKNEV